MASPEQKLDLKIRALREAVDTFSDTDLADSDPAGDSDSQTTIILKRADRFYGWLMGTVRLIVRTGPVVGETSDASEPKTPATEGETVQINTGEKFSVAIDTRDAAGYATDATVEWSIADETIATVVHDDDDDQKGWVISGAPGSTVLTVTVTDVEPPLVATLAVDVVPAGTATVAIATGPAVPESAPQPAPLTATVASDPADPSGLSVLFTADNKGEGSVSIDPGDSTGTVANAGDGVTQTGHVYAAAGTYSAVVTDDDNATRTVVQEVVVPAP